MSSQYRPHANIISITDPHAKQHLAHAETVELPPATAKADSGTTTSNNGPSGADEVKSDPFRNGDDPRAEEEAAKKADGHNWTWISGGPQFQLPDAKEEDLPTLSEKDTTPASEPENIGARHKLQNEAILEKVVDKDEIIYVEEADGTADLTG